MARRGLGLLLVLAFALALWSGGGFAQDLLPTPKGQLGGAVPMPTPAIPVTPPAPPLATIPILLAPAPGPPTPPPPPADATIAVTPAAPSADEVARAAGSVVTIRIDSGVAGSGVVVTDGIVVTARDVVGDASHVSVTDARGERAAATVAGVDPESGLAVLKLDSRIGRPLAFAADTPSVGEPVSALGAGNDPGAPTIDRGRVISTDFWFPAGPAAAMLIETSAAAPLGTDGGALIDADGNLVGVLLSDRIAGNGEAASPAAGSTAAIRYAAPAALVARVVRDFSQGGRVAYPFLGVQVAPATDDPTGPERIVAVAAGSPADRARLRAGDVLLALDGRAFGPQAPFSIQLLAHAPGDRIALRVRRDGVDRTLDVTLGARPPV